MPPKPKRLTEGDFTVADFQLSPDGTRIVIERRDSPLIHDYVTTDLSVLEMASGTLTPLVTGIGYDGGAVWSPDGAFLLYSSAAGNTTSDFYENSQLFKIPVDGGEAVRLAADFDEEINNLRWTPTGIYFLAWQGTERKLFRLDAESGRATPVASQPPVIFSTDFSTDGTALAFVGHDATSLPEVYLTAVEPFAPLAISTTSEALASWDVGSSEVITWTSSDGARIEGVVHKPSDFDPGKRYPLLVVIHGGPRPPRGDQGIPLVLRQRARHTPTKRQARTTKMDR